MQKPIFQGLLLLKAEWRLTVELRLPWRPRIDILGSTLYTLDPDSSRVNLLLGKFHIRIVTELLKDCICIKSVSATCYVSI